MRFDFATSTKIIFGGGTLQEAGPLARELGRHALVVTGRDPTRAQVLHDRLKSVYLTSTMVSIGHEPTTSDIINATAEARAANCDFVIGFGGGAALDAAKAIAALLRNGGDLIDYLEVIGGAKPLSRPSAPCIAIPTTAGTGAEVTRNAVLTSAEHRVKVSLRSPHLLPRLALVDPELTHTLPPATTASTGLDALTQLIEPYVSSRSNPLTDPLCIEGIRRAARSLRRAVDDGSDASAREDMALASLFGGLALANAGLGAVHGFAGPIGGMFPAPHGAVCAVLLPHVMEANLAALVARGSQSNCHRRYEEVARVVTDEPHATAADGVKWTRNLVTDLKIPPLSRYGVTRDDAAQIVEAAEKASSMKANPIALTTAELHAILASAL
jgi:alcohol dehydrogenase class IV